MLNMPDNKLAKDWDDDNPQLLRFYFYTDYIINSNRDKDQYRLKNHI